MSHIPLLSIKRRTGVSLRLFRRSGFLLLLLPAVVLTAVQLRAQAPTAYTPKELLATDPRVFADWLETHRPPLVSPGQKARILEALPSKGEITNLDDAGRQKLAALKQLLQATDRESGYEVKVTDVAYARVVVFERSLILISKSALMLLDAEDLQALAAHEIGHEYFTVEYASAFTSRDHRRLKDLELLCDAIAIVTVHRLGMNPARLTGAVDKITRYNQKHFPTRIDGTNYPTIAERRSFARKVTAWLQGGLVQLPDDQVGIPELVQSKAHVRWRPSGASADPQSSSRGLPSPVHIWCEHDDIEDMQPANHYQPRPPSGRVSASTSCASQHPGAERMTYGSRIVAAAHFRRSGHLGSFANLSANPGHHTSRTRRLARQPRGALLIKSRHPIDLRSKSLGFEPRESLEDIAGV